MLVKSLFSISPSFGILKLDPKLTPILYILLTIRDQEDAIDSDLPFKGTCVLVTFGSGIGQNDGISFFPVPQLMGGSLS
jgi:hypothetical protein